MSNLSVKEILGTEFSEVFVQGMKDRMVMSFYKYGYVRDALPHKVDAIASLTDRLRKYAETGNTEFLMDAANLAMMEYMYPRHPKAHFRATDSDESPGRRLLKTGQTDSRSNAEIGTNPNSKTAKFRD